MPQTPPSAGSTQHAFPSTAAEVKLEGDKLKPKKKTAAGPKRKFAKEAAAVLSKLFFFAMVHVMKIALVSCYLVGFLLNW